MCLKVKENDAFLLLEDGTVLAGQSFGADKDAHGEVGEFKYYISEALMILIYCEINDWYQTLIGDISRKWWQ